MIAYVRRTPIEREYLCSVETNVLDFAHATTVVERETDRERQTERERETEGDKEWKKKTDMEMLYQFTNAPMEEKTLFFVKGKSFGYAFCSPIDSIEKSRNDVLPTVSSYPPHKRVKTNVHTEPRDQHSRAWNECTQLAKFRLHAR